MPDREFQMGGNFSAKFGSVADAAAERRGRRGHFCRPFASRRYGAASFACQNSLGLPSRPLSFATKQAKFSATAPKPWRRREARSQIEQARLRVASAVALRALARQVATLRRGILRLHSSAKDGGPDLCQLEPNDGLAEAH
jgi:hypothetical protein